MRVIRPITFQQSQLVSSNTVESVAAYVAGTTYGLDATVLYNERIYKSLNTGNVGHQPDTSPTWWLDIAPSNKTAMFDTQVSTQSTASGLLEVNVKPGEVFDSLALLNLEAVSLKLEITDSVTGDMLYEREMQLDNSTSSVIDWSTYFFEPFDFVDTVVFTAIPQYSTSNVRLSLYSSSTAKTGAMIYGNMLTLGGTQYGVNTGIVDYSVKQTDEFGNTTFVQRAFSKRIEPTIFVDNTKLNYVNKALQSLRAKPTVWLISEDTRFDTTATFGYYKDYSIEISYPTASLLSLTIEGLI